MARYLTSAAGTAPRRRLAWFALVLGVIVVHGCVTESVGSRMAELTAEQAMPSRMEVAYVREMALTAPPAAATPAAPPAPAAPAPRPARAKPAAKPASAPDPAREEPAEPSVAAASTAPEDSAPSSVAAASAAAENAASSAAAATSAASAAGDPAAIALATAAAAARAAAVAAQPSSAASGAAQAFEWPASTRMSYLLTGNYRGEVNGSAQVEWVREGSHYQVHVDFIVGPKFAPVITQRSTSDGEITAQGLAPRRYDQDIKLLMNRRPRQTILFEQGSVLLANGERRESPPGVQDSASQVVQLTYVFSTRPDLLRVGSSVDIPLALPKKVGLWTYDVIEEVALDTPFGRIAGIHLRPRNDAQKAGSIRVEMWMAPALRYLPARLRFVQDADTYVDLMIEKLPELAN